MSRVTGTPHFTVTVLTRKSFLYRPSGRFRRSVFLAAVPSAAESTIPLRPRQIRDGRHGPGLDLTHRRRDRHRLPFALAPAFGAVGDGTGGARGLPADGAAQRHRGGA
jgi:hypothetical protein